MASRPVAINEWNGSPSPLMSFAAHGVQAGLDPSAPSLISLGETSRQHAPTSSHAGRPTVVAKPLWGLSPLAYHVRLRICVGIIVVAAIGWVIALGGLGFASGSCSSHCGSVFRYPWWILFAHASLYGGLSAVVGSQILSYPASRASQEQVPLSRFKQHLMVFQVLLLSQAITVTDRLISAASGASADWGNELSAAASGFVVIILMDLAALVFMLAAVD
eukprot:jgi/Mesvir1/16790/Mv15160-RA.1